MLPIAIFLLLFFPPSPIITLPLHILLHLLLIFPKYIPIKLPSFSPISPSPFHCTYLNIYLYIDILMISFPWASVTAIPFNDMATFTLWSFWRFALATFNMLFKHSALTLSPDTFSTTVLPVVETWRRKLTFGKKIKEKQF